MEIRKLNKKGVVGLDVAEAVMFALLIIGVISVASILTFYSLLPSIEAVALVPNTVGTATMEVGSITNTGYTLAQSTLKDFSGATINAITNASGVVIPAGNYTLTSNVLKNATAINWLSVNINYTYTYTSTSSAPTAIVQNITNANVSFFGNTSTFFSILSVVVIIALIGLIVLYIRQFRSEGNRATA